MAGLPQLQGFNLKDIDRSIKEEELLRRWMTPTAPLAPPAPRTPEDDAFDAWAAKQGAEEAKISLDEFGGTEPSYSTDSWLDAGTAGLFGSLIGGYMGSRATNRATDARLAASQAAIDEQRRQLNQTRADLAPYRERAAPARNQLAIMMGLQPDAASYGRGDPTKNPLWGSGYQTVPQYKPNLQMRDAANSWASPQQGNQPALTNAISNALYGMKK